MLFHSMSQKPAVHITRQIRQQAKAVRVEVQFFKSLTKEEFDKIYISNYISHNISIIIIILRTSSKKHFMKNVKYPNR